MVYKFSLTDPRYRGRSIFAIFNFIFMILLMACMILPVIKVLSDSFNGDTVYGFNLWPSNPTVDGYVYILAKGGTEYLRAFGVSVYTTIVGTFIGLLLSAIGAYILIQKEMPGNKFFGYMFLFTMMFNAGTIPLFLVIKAIGLYNSLFAVIFPLSMNVYNLVLMRSFFEQLPSALFEAAEIDGCSPYGIFFRIVLPLSKAALASIGLFFAVAFWSEYVHYVIYISDTAKYNFQVKLRTLVIDDTFTFDGNYNASLNTVKNAAIIIAIIPFLFIYPFCQKYFMTGVTMGAVKE